MDALWPNADGDRAHQAFATNLHRLRKLLGRETAIVLTGNRISIDGSSVWVDGWAFERLLGQAEAVEARGDRDAAARLAERALGFYHGAFLGKENKDSWALSMRERLRAKFLRHTTKLGQYLESKSRWRSAAECYEKGLEVDDLAEELYRRLMVCYMRLGNHGEALTAYRRCRQTLSASLGIEPSSQTEAVRNAIMTGK